MAHANIAGGSDVQNVRHIRVHSQGVRSPMDVARPKGKRHLRRFGAVAVGVVGVAVATGYVAMLGPALPTVRADAVWMGTVERGEFVRDVRGPGMLVPMRRRWITALTAGRVDEILAEPGTALVAATILYRLSNPDVEVQLLTVRQQLSDAEAKLVALASRLESDELAQQALIAQVRTQYLEAKHRDEMNRELTRRRFGNRVGALATHRGEPPWCLGPGQPHGRPRSPSAPHAAGCIA